MSDARSVYVPGDWGEPGTWCRGTLDGEAVVFLSCESCGRTGPLVEHKVDDDGIVEPSIVCDCGYHRFARLKHWDGNARGGK